MQNAASQHSRPLCCKHTTRTIFFPSELHSAITKIKTRHPAQQNRCSSRQPSTSMPTEVIAIQCTQKLKQYKSCHHLHTQKPSPVDAHENHCHQRHKRRRHFDAILKLSPSKHTKAINIYAHKSHHHLTPNESNCIIKLLPANSSSCHLMHHQAIPSQPSNAIKHSDHKLPSANTNIAKCHHFLVMS